MSVTVWWASLHDVRPWHASLLTEAESARAQAYRRDPDRDRFTLANALLRLAIADRLGAPAHIDRSCDRCGEPHGKPRVIGSALEVSVSHSGSLVAVALTDAGAIGVDVEEVKPGHDLSLMLHHVFSPDELAALPEPERWFYQAWTRKEAVLKATGQGMRGQMSTITVLPSSTYNIQDLAPRPGYAAAVSVLTEQPFTVSELDGAPLLTR